MATTARQAMFENILTASVESAAVEQGLSDMASRLERIVPDITDQYSGRRLDSHYLKVKVRNQHAFQMSLIERVVNEFSQPVIVDIGDSAGTHIQYIKGILPAGKQARCLSVNLDGDAVEKIRSKGLEAIKTKAEDVAKYNIEADIFLCFEMLEHMADPSNFLHSLSRDTKARYLIFTVPYVRDSRVGLYHIRQKKEGAVSAEVNHMFELDPEDWKLIASHSGWAVKHEQIYLQYPRLNILRMTSPAWRRYDFEGFYGLILTRDETWSSRYTDWQA
jgi:hypothetical protein